MSANTARESDIKLMALDFDILLGTPSYNT
jgi:hypothetical protein